MSRISNPGRVKNLHFSVSSRTALGLTQASLQWVPETLSQGVRWQKREADNSFPTNAEVKKTWIHTSSPKYVLETQYLVKHRDNLTFFNFFFFGYLFFLLLLMAFIHQ
jgi:hypothetical protein